MNRRNHRRGIGYISLRSIKREQIAFSHPKQNAVGVKLNAVEQKRGNAMPDLLRNCRLGEGCHRTWDSLQATEATAVRFCSECREKVYYAGSAQELLDHLKLGRCVAFTVEKASEEMHLGGPKHFDYDPGTKLSWD